MQSGGATAKTMVPVGLAGISAAGGLFHVASAAAAAVCFRLSVVS